MEFNPWIINDGVNRPPKGLNRGDLIDVIYRDGSEAYGMTALISAIHPEFKRESFVGNPYCAVGWSPSHNIASSIVKWRFHIPHSFPTREMARQFCKGKSKYTVIDRGIESEHRWGVTYKNTVKEI